MAILEILKYPEPTLQKTSARVKNITAQTVQLIDDMLDTMYAAPGVGLAAPQVGALERIIVMDVDHENPHKQIYKLINPVVTRAEGEIIWEEGCLSVVDFTAEVKRAAQVEVVALDENEKEFKIEAEGLLAVALQHEIDHLDGKLFIDRISRLKRDLYSRRRKKMLKTGIEPPKEGARVMIKACAHAPNTAFPNRVITTNF
jgi:peptide deformylase